MNAAHWLGNLAAWSVQAAALILAGAAAAWAFRLRVPRIRLAYWQALLALCLLLPAVEPWRIPADFNIDYTVAAVQPVSPHRTPARSLPWSQALLLILAAGCAARALWLGAGFVKLHRWRRDAREFSGLAPRLDALRAAVAPHAGLRLSSSLSGPVTFGLRRPIILLPARFAELPPDIQEAIVCHELLHVRRRDWIVTVAEQAVRAALWFHPAVWWLIGQAQLAREQTVDREVVALTGNRHQYLNALLAMAGNRPALDLAPATLFLRKRHLKSRVALLLKEVTMSKHNVITFCAASCGVLFAAGWLALHTFPLQAAPAPQDPDAARLLHSVPPQYPPEALEKHIEGAVVLEAHIDAEGHVSNAKVLSGPEELHGAALAAILQRHYSPAAMTLPTTTEVTIDFKLPKNGPPLPFTLKSIQIEGLSDMAHDALLQRLPVHPGDTVDMDSMRSVGRVVRAFDDDLVTSTRPAEGILRISLAPREQTAPPTRIRVGGNVQQAKLLVKVNPVYPPLAKSAGIEGVVRLQATLGKDGAVENLTLLEGHPLLAAAAMDAVRQWQYQTTLLNGDPVEVLTQVDINFTLAK
jgi:TonB family protein